VSRVILHTNGGAVVGEESEISEEDMPEFRGILLGSVSNGDSFILDTEDGFVVVPAAQLLYVEFLEDREE